MTALPVDNLGLDIDTRRRPLFFVIVYDLARLHQYRHLAYNHDNIIPASLRQAGCLLLSAFSVGLSSVFNGFLVLSSQAPCTVECRPLQRLTLTDIANGIDQGLVTTDMSSWVMSLAVWHSTRPASLSQVRFTDPGYGYGRRNRITRKTIPGILYGRLFNCLVWWVRVKQTCQVSRNFRESPEMGLDLQVSRNCPENSRNWGNLSEKKISRKKCEFLSYLSKMCVSTHDYHLMLGKNMISQLEMTENPATTPPPPLNRVGSRRSRKRLKKFNNLNLAALG